MAVKGGMRTKRPQVSAWCSDSHPLDVVLGLLLDEVDAFQDVCDVVDPSLLHL